MSVITISRGSFSGGKMLADCLARRLGYRSIDRAIVVEKAAAHGVSQKELVDALQKPPTFLERFTHRKYLYLTLMQAALTEEVRAGHAVYHGNAGHLFLQGGLPILRIRIIAPLSYRVREARKRLQLTDAEVVAYIHERDQDRRKWTQYLYGVEWGDPSLYDVLVNLEYIDVSRACEMIATLARTQPCHEFGPECQAVMNDLALASRVKARLALEPDTSHLEFSVHSSRGQVAIRGKVSSIDLIPAVERVARTVEGVRGVNLEQVAPMPQV